MLVYQTPFTRRRCVPSSGLAFHAVWCSHSITFIFDCDYAVPDHKHLCTLPRNVVSGSIWACQTADWDCVCPAWPHCQQCGECWCRKCTATLTSNNWFQTIICYSNSSREKKLSCILLVYGQCFSYDRVSVQLFHYSAFLKVVETVIVDDAHLMCHIVLIVCWEVGTTSEGVPTWWRFWKC